ncbi:MAG: YidC/Oxa1 family membrane protein insertase [Patescibacteria group bacterium]
MMAFFHTVLYVPIYNLLILLVDKLPGADIGLAVVLVTIIIRLIIMPLSFAAQKTARAMKNIEPELKVIRDTLKDNKEEQARAMMALYKKYGINPFASILTILIQLPIIITLYWVFYNKTLLTVDPSILYSFVAVPATISPVFLGLITITSTSVVLALIAGITQYLLALYAIPAPPKSSEDKSMQADISRAMTLQMRYVFPVIMAAIAYASGAIAIYFITSNLFGIVQEYFVRRSMQTKTPTVIV